MECIELKKIICYAYHGITEQERIVGNNYRIDLELFLDLSKAITSDKLDDTIDYTGIFSLVKEEMAVTSNLLEHVAGRIVRTIKQKYPPISKINIRLAKIKPPVEGEIREAAIIISE